MTEIKNILRASLLTFLCLVFVSIDGFTQGETDTAKRHRIREVNINSAADQKVFTGPAAVQNISAGKIQKLPVLQLSDALKYMSGVVVRDYGGTGGMKTVSVRGLGTQHTGVAYDDIALSDCQTGQIDLSKLTLANVVDLTLVVGSDPEIFVPARLLSFSSLLKIKTLSIPANKFGFRVEASAGLYNLYSGQISVYNKISSNKHKHRFFLWNLSADYLYSKGNYPYLIRYGGATDSVSREIRQNSAVRNYNIEANAVFQIDNTQRVSAKVYYYDSDRELPSATIFYNNVSHQKLWNKNAFAQLHYHKYFNKKWACQANAKYNYDYTRYLDPDFLNEDGFLDNRYCQTEGYFANTLLYTPISKENATDNIENLQFALAHDDYFQQLTGNSIDYEKPSRWTSLTSLSSVISGKKWTVNGSVLYTYVNNILKENRDISDYNHVSPTVGFSYKFNKTLSIRGFYKDIFRMPTFNDLYYREVGNLNLKPEMTHQLNLGFVADNAFVVPGCLFASATVDAYFNVVNDKIVAFPAHNLFSWTILNYGKVYIAGFEINNFWRYHVNTRHRLQLNWNLTYQKAVDRTDPDSKTFNHQIPYTPLLSGSMSLIWTTPWFDVTYAFMACGKRYALPQNVPANEISGYFDHSITLGYEYEFCDERNPYQSSKMSVKIEFLNIANRYYEIIRNYPMQGFGFRAKIAYTFGR